MYKEHAGTIRNPQSWPWLHQSGTCQPQATIIPQVIQEICSTQINSTDLNSSRLRSHNILASILESQLYYPGIGLKCGTIHIHVPLTSWHYYRCSQCIVNGSQKLQTHSDVKPREWLMHPQTGGEHCDQSHVLSWDPNSHKGRNQWSYQIVKAAKTAKKQTAFRKTNYFNHKWITRCKGFRESYRATSF